MAGDSHAGTSERGHEALEDRVLSKAEREKRGGGRGRGGGGQSREVLVSKALSKLLRHQADNAKIKLDEEGYAPLGQVVGLTLIPSPW